MSNNICWMCECNFSYEDYNESKLLDEEGNKPCFDCLMESGAFDEVEEEEL